MSETTGGTKTLNDGAEMSAQRLKSRVQSLRIPPKPVKKTSSRWPWVITVLALLVAGYSSLGGAIPYVPRLLNVEEPSQAANLSVPSNEAAARSQGDNASTAGSATKRTTATGGTAAAPKIAPGTIVLESKGYIIPEQQILVSPQVSGRVIELNFEAGQQVKAGDILAVLDSTEYKADHARAIAQVAAAQERLQESQRGNRPDEIRQATAELAEAKTQLEQARRTFERRRELFAQKIVTPQDLEDAESEFNALGKRVEKLTAVAQLMIDGPREERKKIAEAELRAAEAELVRSQWRLDNTIIPAPISGTILKKNAELGNLVNPIAFNGSFSLCDIADLSKLEVELDIQERDISKVKTNQKCRVRADAFPERFYDGYVSRLMPIANRAKGAVPVRVRVAVPMAEQGQYLKPEMGAIVTFFAETVDPATLPGAAAPATSTTSTQPTSAAYPATGPSTPVSAESTVNTPAVHSSSSSR